MSRHDDDRFRMRPGAPKNRSQRFVSQVLREMSKAGGKSIRKTAARPGMRLGRGHVAARFTGRILSPDARRVTIKTRLVNLRQAGGHSMSTHLRYIEREGVGREGEAGQAYGPATDCANLITFEGRGRDDRHQFRFIVSPEDAEQLDDLRRYIRTLMQRMEADLGTRLDWVAVDHWNTDNPHTHIVLRGRDDTGKDLIISRDYIAHGMRERATGLATEWLGPRTELEMRHGLQREVEQERWTSLDRTLQRESQAGTFHLERLRQDNRYSLLVGRLHYLQRMGLAAESAPSTWRLRSDVEPVLRALGERGDIVRTMQRAVSGMKREWVIFESREHTPPVIGRVVAKGLADELYDRGYLVVDGIDGKAHYVAMPAGVKLEPFVIGAVVKAQGFTEVRSADRTIAALAVDGVYRVDHHRTMAKGRAMPGQDLGETVGRHVRRLEALRQARIVERIAEGVWRVPPDLPEKGRRYDAHRLGSVSVALQSHLPIERQVRAIGATWLDQQLIDKGKKLGHQGFGSEVRQQLQARTDFLVDQGLAERRGQRVVLVRNLLATLRERDVTAAAKKIAQETGWVHRPVTDGGRVCGAYRRSVLLVSGRFAMLGGNTDFSLVPWRPLIEPWKGQSLTAVVRGQSVSWEFGRQRGGASIT